MRTALQLSAGLLSAGCVVPYIRDIFAGTTKPHRVSWFAFALLATLGAAVQLRGELAAGTWLAVGAAIGFTCVFLLSFRYGVGGTTTGDRVHIAATAVAAGAWLVTGSAALGVAMVCAIEAAAIAPTVRKAYAKPETETLSTWAVDGLAGILAAVSATSVVEVAYPISHIAINGAVVVAMVAGARRRPRPQHMT